MSFDSVSTGSRDALPNRAHRADGGDGRLVTSDGSDAGRRGRRTRRRASTVGAQHHRRRCRRRRGLAGCAFARDRRRTDVVSRSDASTGGSSQHLQRTLGLAGVRTGVTAGNVDLFARARGGFLRFGSEPATVCILIFPPPLSCQLAAGYTAFAAEVGGGASVGLIPSGRLRASLEAGDLMVRYGLTSFRPGGTTTDGFISHNLLVTIGAAWRF